MKVDVNFYDENGKGLEVNNLSEVSKANITTKSVYVVISKENGKFIEELTLRNSEGEIRFIPLEPKEQKVNITREGIVLNEGALAIINDNPRILSPEHTDKLDEMYEYLKNSGKLLTELSNVNITVVDGKDENKLSVKDFRKKIADDFLRKEQDTPIID